MKNHPEPQQSSYEVSDLYRPSNSHLVDLVEIGGCHPFWKLFMVSPFSFVPEIIKSFWQRIFHINPDRNAVVKFYYIVVHMLTTNAQLENTNET